MRVMVLIKATKNSEAGGVPSEKMLTEMSQFNEELFKAGVLTQPGEGLHPSSKAKRLRFGKDRGTGHGFNPGPEPEVIDGPFAETRELIAGFWLWKVASLDEAVAWMKKCPHPMPGEEVEVEIRQVFEAEDFGPELTAWARAREARLRVEFERKD